MTTPAPQNQPCPKCSRPMYGTWCQFCTTVKPDVPNPSRATGLAGIRQRNQERIYALGAKPAAPWFEPEDYHRKLLGTEVDVFLASTGAGAGIQQDLWAPAGASAFLKGTVFPYYKGEMNEFLGLVPPTGYCSEATAMFIASQAFVRAREAAWRAGTPDRAALGIGVTASVASQTAHKGDHRAFIAIVSTLPGGSFIRRMTLDKDVGNIARANDEHMVRLATIEVLRAALGLVDPLAVEAESLSEDNIRAVVMTHPFHAYGRRGKLPSSTGRMIFFPGTFNPIHDGHREMARDTRTNAWDREVVFTVNVNPVHKPALKGTDLLDKVAMFRAEVTHDMPDTLRQPFEPSILFTQDEPLFVDKIRKRTGSSWIVGADTLVTLLDPKWGPRTEDVVLAFVETQSKLHVYPCMWKGSRITARSVLAGYNLMPQTNGDLPSYIVDIPVDVADVRSTQIRDQRARANAIDKLKE